MSASINPNRCPLCWLVGEHKSGCTGPPPKTAPGWRLSIRDCDYVAEVAEYASYRSGRDLAALTAACQRSLAGDVDAFAEVLRRAEGTPPGLFRDRVAAQKGHWAP